MLSERLDLIMKMLNCSNAEFERQTGYSRTTVSRFRTGSRTPKANSISIRKLVDALYIYADKTNALPLLSQICAIEPKTDKALIKASLTEWLFQMSSVNNEAYEKLLKDIELKASKEKKALKYFGDKLSYVMDILDLSNAKLSKLLLIDSSYISRLRNGVRTPRIGSTLLKDIGSILFKRASDQKKLEELSLLINNGNDRLFCEDEDYAREEFAKWLCNISYDSSNVAIDSFLERFDSFSIDKLPQLPPLESLVSQGILTEDNAKYFGIQGLRRAVIRFLGNTASKEANTLYLYSDAPMEWMVGNKQFAMTWAALMVHVLRRGTRIKIIHNIDRNITEMMAAIESWLPLYMSGLIEPFYLKSSKKSPFAHTLFLSEGRECVFSDHLAELEDSAVCYYSIDCNELKYKQKEFDSLLRKSNPLIHVFTKHNREDFRFYANKTAQRPGEIHTLLQSLPIETMNSKLLASILDKNAVPEALKNDILRFHKTASNTFMDSSRAALIHEFVCLPTEEKLADGKIFLNLGHLYNDLKIPYTKEDYSAHISDIISLLEGNNNYHFHILPENPFSNIEMIIKGNSATIINQGDGFIAMSFEHPYMINAFIEYLNRLQHQYERSRNEVKKILSDYL